jgi:hypothetical protein
MEPSIPGTVSNCYSASRVTGAGSGGGLVGCNEAGQIDNSFWDIQTSGQATSDGGTGKTTAEMHDPNTFRAAGWDFVGQADGPDDIWAEPEGGGYPILCWQLPPLQGLPRFSGGTGEPNDPYRISTAAELNSIGQNPRLMECHFKLIEKLDLAGFHFYPIGGPDHPYAGVFDGNGHTISHLRINGNSTLGLFGRSTLGLFGRLGSGAEVKNLGVVDVNITGEGSDIGGLAGSNWGGTVAHCYSTGAVSGSGGVGGLLGINGGTVTQCYSTGAVEV